MVQILKHSAAEPQQAVCHTAHKFKISLISQEAQPGAIWKWFFDLWAVKAGHTSQNITSISHSAAPRVICVTCQYHNRLCLMGYWAILHRTLTGGVNIRWFDILFLFSMFHLPPSPAVLTYGRPPPVLTNGSPTPPPDVQNRWAEQSMTSSIKKKNYPWLRVIWKNVKQWCRPQVVGGTTVLTGGPRILSQRPQALREGSLRKIFWELSDNAIGHCESILGALPGGLFYLTPPAACTTAL